MVTNNLPKQLLPINMTATINRQAKGRYQLQGELDFNTVPILLAESNKLFAEEAGDLVIDLAGVQRGNSAGLGLLLEWMRLAKMQNRTIQFHHVPDDMLAIAQVSDLDNILFLKH